MNPNPAQISAIPVTRTDWLEHRRIRPDLGMAVHAGLGRRNPRERGLLDRRMAVPAVDANAPDVVGVAELDGLLDELVLLGGPRRPHQREHQPAQKQDEAEDAKQGGARQCIRTAWKDLTHRQLVKKKRPKPTLDLCR